MNYISPRVLGHSLFTIFIIQVASCLVTVLTVQYIPDAMHISESSFVQGLWVCHKLPVTDCRSMPSMLSPVRRGHPASQLLEILTLLMPGVAHLMTPTYPGEIGRPADEAELPLPSFGRAVSVYHTQ